MRGSWDLTPEEKAQYVPYIQDCIDRLFKENKTLDCIDLTDTPLSPQTMREIMKTLGYSEVVFDTNGWEYDFWITFDKKDIPKRVVVSGTGITFSLQIQLEEE